MKRFWMRALLCFALCAALLTGCALSPSSRPAESPTDPLTGQELVWPGQRPVAITIDNAAASTTQWGLSTASLVLEALTAQQQATRLCLVYPAVGAVPQVGPVSAGQDLYWRLLVGQQVLPVQRGGGHRRPIDDDGWQHHHTGVHEAHEIDRQQPRGHQRPQRDQDPAEALRRCRRHE